MYEFENDKHIFKAPKFKIDEFGFWSLSQTLHI